MEWQVKYEPVTRTKPWSVYKYFSGGRFFERGFWTEADARDWAHKKEKNHIYPEGEGLGKVDEASAESFPASDPPAWIKSTAHVTKETTRSLKRKECSEDRYKTE